MFKQQLPYMVYITFLKISWENFPRNICLSVTTRINSPDVTWNRQFDAICR